MVKKLALDTNAAIGLLKGEAAVLTVLQRFDILCLPVTVCGELLFGALNAKLSILNRTRYLAFMDSCEIIYTDLLIAEKYAAIRLALKQAGRPIPENDVWIAAACIARQILIMTFDKHVRWIAGMDIITQEK